MSKQRRGTGDADARHAGRKWRRVRPLMLVSAVSALALAGVGLGLGSQQRAAAAPRVAAACTPLKPTKSEHIDANGKGVKTTRLTAARYAVKKYYRLGDIDFTTVVPPQGFDLATAGISTLRAYGYEDVPTGKALMRWRANNGHKFHSVESEPCVGSPHDVSRAPRAAVAASQSVTPLVSFSSVNWGGFIDGGYNDFTSASLSAAQITYDAAYCGDQNASSAAVWAGLGGRYTNNLLQSGYWAGLFQMRDTSGNPIWDSLNGSTLFWEALNEPNGSPGEPPVFIGADHAGAGAILHTRTSYVPSTGHATFTWTDLTTGYTWTPITITDGSHFYDGSTADFITEDREGTNLRHYAPSITQTFTDATAGTGGNGSEYGVFSYPGWQQALLEDLNNNILLTNHIVSGSDRSYIQTWKGCN